MGRAVAYPNKKIRFKMNLLMRLILILILAPLVSSSSCPEFGASSFNLRNNAEVGRFIEKCLDEVTLPSEITQLAASQEAQTCSRYNVNTWTKDLRTAAGSRGLAVPITKSVRAAGGLCNARAYVAKTPVPADCMLYSARSPVSSPRTALVSFENLTESVQRSFAQQGGRRRLNHVQLEADDHHFTAGAYWNARNPAAGWTVESSASDPRCGTDAACNSCPRVAYRRDMAICVGWNPEMAVVIQARLNAHAAGHYIFIGNGEPVARCPAPGSCKTSASEYGDLSGYTDATDQLQVVMCPWNPALNAYGYPVGVTAFLDIDRAIEWTESTGCDPSARCAPPPSSPLPTTGLSGLAILAIAAGGVFVLVLIACCWKSSNKALARNDSELHDAARAQDGLYEAEAKIHMITEVIASSALSAGAPLAVFCIMVSAVVVGVVIKMWVGETFHPRIGGGRVWSLDAMRQQHLIDGSSLGLAHLLMSVPIGLALGSSVAHIQDYTRRQAMAMFARRLKEMCSQPHMNPVDLASISVRYASTSSRHSIRVPALLQRVGAPAHLPSGLLFGTTSFVFLVQLKYACTASLVPASADYLIGAPHCSCPHCSLCTRVLAQHSAPPTAASGLAS